MKRISILLALLLVITMIGCAEPRLTNDQTGETPAQQQETPAQQQETPEPSTEVPEPAAPNAESVYIDDFTVQTVDGGTFTLSEAQKDHELVLINLFATWCGPCAREFPALQEAWSMSSDRVAVIALSIEPDDTLEALKEYADSMGLTFPMGREEGTDLSRFVTVGIPTTILVDQTGRIAALEVGAKATTQEFLDFFDGFTGSNYDPNKCTYTVYAYDTEDNMVAGVVVNFCTETSCTPVTTNEEGVATFSGAPGRYHVQIVKWPDGRSLYYESDAEFYTEPYAQSFWIPFTIENE